MGSLKPCLTILFLSIAIPAPSRGQSNCSAIATVETKTYGFRPAKLSDRERKEKAAVMDSFWSLVKRSGPQGVACLRSLLEKQQDGFAVFDEASLLYSLDRSAESTGVVARAIAKTDLADVQAANYVGVALRLAQEGVDIEPIANNYLNAKNDVTTYLARHGGYKLDRTAGAILLYGIMPTDKIDEAISRAVNSDVAEVRNAAVVMWSLNMTERSFKGLAALGKLDGFSDEAKHQVRFVMTPFEVRVTAPKYTREQMLAKISKFPEMEMDRSEDPAREDKALDNSVYATFTNADVETLRESRRKLITGVSNESVEGYVEMSRVLIHLINKLHMYSEYRTFGQ
jgi:hypothetical protein